MFVTIKTNLHNMSGRFFGCSQGQCHMSHRTTKIQFHTWIDLQSSFIIRINHHIHPKRSAIDRFQNRLENLKDMLTYLRQFI